MKPLLKIGQGINIYPYSAIPVTTGQSSTTGTICIMEHMEGDPSTLCSAAPTLTHGLINLFNVPGGLRIEKKVWILEKAGLDAVWGGKQLLTRCEEEDAWMEVNIQQYLGTDPMFVPRLGEIADSSFEHTAFISRLQRDEKETKEWQYNR
ncbi:hypothetical protein HETIRDRAFT_426573 [Heterobasidion irregulare TC 32-1]|uniref:Uncharacterized protein n=1 Tax=Heterobasidion irregulare (strain TC 32-1) TaxID=747525 RepID=W4KBV3_HETIT|nr:uncharacterized protein HETIRDRAFT_426573 [Heterobasidion irregulare TC 32-1]ETW83224.1 hypothetical protein HETIRDRAFT_426573 [Heterobasidion irregulare TC 32-1]